MENFDLVNYNEESGELPNPDSELDKPIPFDDSDSAPNQAASPVSRKPLTLGSSTAGANPTPKPTSQPPTPHPAAKPAPAPSPAAAASRPTVHANNAEKITHLKTFFTKLHEGAIVYLDDLVTEWLKDHPEVNIKRTNITVGEIQAKKTEPNLIITIWY